MPRFSFEDYYSENKSEFAKDLTSVSVLVRSINKYIKEKNINNLQRVYNKLVFFRNIFTKEAVLEYVFDKYKETHRSIILPLLCVFVIEHDEDNIGDFEKYKGYLVKFVSYEWDKETIDLIEEFVKEHKL